MLRIGRLTDYAIVVLAHMARHAYRCVHPASDLSEHTGVPLPTVQKILKELTRHGLVVSMRGARGGYALAHDPSEVTLVQILEAMEGPVALTACAIPHAGACTESERCGVSEHWPTINRAMRVALEQVTLLQLSAPAERPARSADSSGRAVKASATGSPLHTEPLHAEPLHAGDERAEGDSVGPTSSDATPVLLAAEPAASAEHAYTASFAPAPRGSDAAPGAPPEGAQASSALDANPGGAPKPPAPRLPCPTVQAAADAALPVNAFGARA